ncbi:putative spherulin 1A precursor [Fusarium heterosporum]|uniref:Putative spherulin 1A n=1 Tax=Fusarium heterosporum TaxID=42747 RepID=A0A8H5SW32_FUSHE|nr:putative spherulin 1A precursor [Fusarium heterosporum]
MRFSTILVFAASTIAAPANNPINPSTLKSRTYENHSHAGDYDSVLPPIVPINTRSSDRDLIAKLMTAPTQAERAKLLDQPGDYIFDFVHATGAGEAVGKGGRSISATALTMLSSLPRSAALTLDVVSATLGGIKTIDGKDIETFRDIIPKNIALGIDSCLKKCGIKRNAKRSIEKFMD